MVPDCRAATSLAQAFHRRDAFAGQDGVLDAGQLLDEAPAVQAITSPSLAMAPALVSTLSAVCAEPGSFAGDEVDALFAEELLSSGTTRSAGLRLPEGSQIRLGR